MNASTTLRRSAVIALVAALCVPGGRPDPVGAQQAAGNPMSVNPFVVADSTWGQASAGYDFGAVSAIYPAPDGRSVWVAERCGANSCVGSAIDPVMRFDLDGNLITRFGAGLFAWPHGMTVDADGNVWVADAVGYAAVPEGWGHVVYKFSPGGELLMTLGRKGVAGSDQGTFTKPNDVLVAPDGSIFVADGHDPDGNNRIVKFDARGRYLMEFGEFGEADGQFRWPHALAMDSRGRLFVGDRGNSRVQVFDQQGNHLHTWTHFGRPSGLFITPDDVLYAADSESNARRNPGVRRGIYIGNALTGELTGFIPDPEPDPDARGTSGAEGVAVDGAGNVYGAEVGPRTVRKYVPRGTAGAAAGGSGAASLGRLLADGRAVFGIFSGPHTPEAGAAMARVRDADFVFYSLESGPFDIPSMEAYRAALRDAWGEGDPPPLVLRVPPIRDSAEAARDHVARARAAAVDAIVFPHVETADEARQAAETAPLSMVIIEDRAGIERARTIVSTPGVDIATPGPGDLRRAYRGDMEAVEDAIQTVLGLCLEFDVPCGITAGVDDIAERLQQGFRVIIVTDPAALSVGRAAAGR